MGRSKMPEFVELFVFVCLALCLLRRVVQSVTYHQVSSGWYRGNNLPGSKIDWSSLPNDGVTASLPVLEGQELVHVALRNKLVAFVFNAGHVLFLPFGRACFGNILKQGLYNRLAPFRFRRQRALSMPFQDGQGFIVHAGDDTAASNVVFCMEHVQDIAQLLQHCPQPLLPEHKRQINGVLGRVINPDDQERLHRSLWPTSSSCPLLPCPMNETQLYWRYAKDRFASSQLPALIAALLNNKYFPHTGCWTASEINDIVMSAKAAALLWQKAKLFDIGIPGAEWQDLGLLDPWSPMAGEAMAASVLAASLFLLDKQAALTAEFGHAPQEFRPVPRHVWALTMRQVYRMFHSWAFKSGCGKLAYIRRVLVPVLVPLADKIRLQECAKDVPMQWVTKEEGSFPVQETFGKWQLCKRSRHYSAVAEVTQQCVGCENFFPGYSDTLIVAERVLSCLQQGSSEPSAAQCSDGDADVGQATGAACSNSGLASCSNQLAASTLSSGGPSKSHPLGVRPIQMKKKRLSSRQRKSQKRRGPQRPQTVQPPRPGHQHPYTVYPEIAKELPSWLGAEQLQQYLANDDERATVLATKNQLKASIKDKNSDLYCSAAADVFKPSPTAKKVHEFEEVCGVIVPEAVNKLQELADSSSSVLTRVHAAKWCQLRDQLAEWFQQPQVCRVLPGLASIVQGLESPGNIAEIQTALQQKNIAVKDAVHRALELQLRSNSLQSNQDRCKNALLLCMRTASHKAFLHLRQHNKFSMKAADYNKFKDKVPLPDLPAGYGWHPDVGALLTAGLYNLNVLTRYEDIVYKMINVRGIATSGRGFLQGADGYVGKLDNGQLGLSSTPGHAAAMMANGDCGQLDLQLLLQQMLSSAPASGS